MEKIRIQLAHRFASLGHDVEFVLQNKRGEWLDCLPSGVPVIGLGARQLRSTVRPLVSYLRARRPGALLAAMWPLTSIAVWARDLGRVPMRVVISDHTDYSASKMSATSAGRFKLQTTMRLTYPRADGVVAVSHGVARSVARFSGLRAERINVVHNPVRLPSAEERQCPCEAAQDWADHAGPRLIAMGSFKEPKNFPLLLRAFETVRKQVDARLLILGEGDLRGELEGLVRDLGIQDDVSMPGFVARPWPYLARADLFVLSSSWEGFGNVIIEALACGTPVVSTDCPSGPREILGDDRYGRLVPVGDARSLAAAIVSGCSESHNREALRRRAAEFSVENAADCYLRLLVTDSSLE